MIFASLACGVGCLFQRGELEPLLQEFTTEGEDELKRVLQRMDTLVQVGTDLSTRPAADAPRETICLTCESCIELFLVQNKSSCHLQGNLDCSPLQLVTRNYQCILTGIHKSL